MHQNGGILYSILGTSLQAGVFSSPVQESVRFPRCDHFKLNTKHGRRALTYNKIKHIQLHFFKKSISINKIKQY